MNTYLSTFVSGFDTFISKQLIKDIPDAEILKVLDGAILFKSNFMAKEIKLIRYLNNSFLVLQQFEMGKGNTTVLNKMLEATLKNPQIVSRRDIHVDNRGSFRVYTSLENNLVSVDYDLLENVERIIERNLHIRRDVKNPSYEFWYLYRSEKIGFFMFRITSTKTKPEQGELRSELADILCLLSNPKPDDVILDPFAGSGAIPLERSKIEKFKGIFALDKNVGLAKDLKDKVKKIRNKKIQKSFFAKGKNFFETSFDSGFFDSVITDPPWGFFEKLEEEVDVFYTKILDKTYEILKKDGRLILLTAKKTEFEKCIEDFKKFKLVEKYNILVSGKKCSVYVLVK